MKIGYYFIITYSNQFDRHWLYKDIGFCLQYERVLHNIPSITCVEIKVTERDRLSQRRIKERDKEKKEDL